MKDRRIFKGSEVGNRAPWIVDLSPPDCVNPDYYWGWNLKRDAKKFLELVDNGISAINAVSICT